MSTRRLDFSIQTDPVRTVRVYTDGVTNKQTGVNAAYQCSETTTGVKRHKPTGWMSPTAYTFERVSIKAPVGRSYCNPNPNPGPYGSIVTGVCGTLSGSSGVRRFVASNHFNGALTEATAKDGESLRNTALIKARAKLKSTDVNLGVAYGERNATARMLGDTATRIAKSFGHLKRGRVRKAMDELGISSKKREPKGSNVPNKWLELQYGWKPWLSDVHGAADALSKRQPDDWKVTARATANNEVSKTYTILAQPEVGQGYDACVVVASARRSVYARIDAVPQNEAIISLASLGILNPLEVAWELVPFSFVVDWAWPIGSYLSSLDAMFGYSSKAYSSSLLVRANWTDNGSTKVGTDGSKIENNWYGAKELVYLSRQVSTSTPIPSLPRFKDPRSFGHMANGLALLATVFGRR